MLVPVTRSVSASISCRTSSKSVNFLDLQCRNSAYSEGRGSSAALRGARPTAALQAPQHRGAAGEGGDFGSSCPTAQRPAQNPESRAVGCSGGKWGCGAQGARPPSSWPRLRTERPREGRAAPRGVSPTPRAQRPPRWGLPTEEQRGAQRPPWGDAARRAVPVLEKMSCRMSGRRVTMPEPRGRKSLQEGRAVRPASEVQQR